jgi:hypothetical protein
LDGVSGMAARKFEDIAIAKTNAGRQVDAATKLDRVMEKRLEQAIRAKKEAA